VANLEALDRELTAESEAELLDIEARMDSLSEATAHDEVGVDVEMGFLPEGAQLITPSWVAAFSDLDLQDANTAASAIEAQTLLSGGTCKNYYNWAKGAGTGIAGTGVGKIQSWIDFGFWFKPPASRFYSIRPLFRFRGYVIVRADDSWYDSKFARVTGSAWTNVHQYNWKGWNHVDVYNVGDDNIDVNRREDLDRFTYNSYLLGGGDWTYIRCTIGLWAYARGGGSTPRTISPPVAPTTCAYLTCTSSDAGKRAVRLRLLPDRPASLQTEACMEHIEALRARYEEELMAIEGVVGVGTAIDEEGAPWLRILTSQPVDAVRKRLPDEVREHAVVVYVGEIEAQ